MYIRILLLLIWLFTGWFGEAFDSWFLPLLGLFFMPWLTLALMWGYTTEFGGWQIFAIVVAVFFDMGTSATYTKKKLKD